MEPYELQQSQALPLGLKIEKSIQRVREWHDHWRGQVYISFSGGKDSTVLLHLVRSIYPDVTAVFCDTGLEYPEIREFVKTFDNVETIRPKMNFREVVEQHGYPVVSKRVAQALRQYREAKSELSRNHILNGYPLAGGGVSKRFSIPLKWRRLLNAPFLISDKCCGKMKKEPFREYERSSGTAPFTGEIAAESEQRLRSYLNTGCNAFESERPKSTPLGFWMEQDILRYLRDFRVPYCSVYGDIIEGGNGELRTTGAQRTGCMFCCFGVHLERGENRFMRMQRTHPRQWDYCIHALGIGRVLNYIGVPYSGMFLDEEAG
jgi:3'-phosphoadenosine 5'-phosphosulfate sulfotransferase (PAPS reductase)/FAD synthetase